MQAELARVDHPARLRGPARRLLARTRVVGTLGEAQHGAEQPRREIDLALHLGEGSVALVPGGDRMRERVHGTAHGHARRQGGEEARHVGHGVRAHAFVATRSLAALLEDPEDPRHLRSGVRGRDGDERNVRAQSQRLAEPRRRSAADGHDRIRAVLREHVGGEVDDVGGHVHARAIEDGDLTRQHRAQIVDEPPTLSAQQKRPLHSPRAQPVRRLRQRVRPEERLRHERTLAM